MHCTDLRIEFTGTVGTPPTCRFGMLCSCILRSHATRTEGTFCSVAGSCVLICRHVTCAVFEVLRTEILFCVDAGRGVTLLIPLYEVLVVQEVTQLLLDEGPDLADLTFLTEQIFVKDVPDWDGDVLLLLERGQRRPGVGVAGGDGRRGVQDIFCHRTAESGVIFFDSIESVRPAVTFSA